MKHLDQPFSLVEWNEKCLPFNFKGYGDHGASIWFVGLEFRGSGVQSEMDGYQHGERVYLLSSEQILREHRNGTRIYDYMAYVMARLRDPANDSIDKYIGNNLLQPGDGSFFTNAYMLPRPSFDADLTPHMREIGFTSIEQYKKTVEIYRFDMLRKLWKAQKRAFAICFGTSAWPAYRKLLNLEHMQPEKITVQKTAAEVQFYEESGVFLTPFFGRWGRGRGFLPFSVVQAVADRMRKNWPKRAEGTDSMSPL